MYISHSQDENDPKKLLAPGNIDKKALERYAIEATSYATEGALNATEFEKNHRGENDVALFDFTSLFASQNAARIIERKGKRILLCVAGDSLLEVCCLSNCMSSVLVVQSGSCSEICAQASLLIHTSYTSRRHTMTMS